MTAGALRETLALLLRDKNRETTTLSADAERSIRRRVAVRWAGLIGAVVVVGALGAATVAGSLGDWGGGDQASPTSIPTPTIGVALATFPVSGGPEFVSPVADLKCGDPVPTPHPTEHDVRFALTQTHAVSPGETIQNPENMPAVNAHLAQTPGTDLGVVADSGISLIIERDGVVAGVVPYGAPEVGWNAPGGMAASEGQYGGQLVAPWIFCPGDDPSTASGIEPGKYDIVGVTRVFSTPESVALFQKLGVYRSGMNLDPANLDPQGVYLPGSYDCAQTINQDSPARACLPDFTPDAKLNADTSTISMLYDKKDLVDEFSAVLVSDPLSVYIPGAEALAWMQDSNWQALGTFDSIADFTCGASTGRISMTSKSSESVSLDVTGVSVDEMSKGGAFHGTALARGVPDGSRAELLPGARIIYLESDVLAIPGTNISTVGETVVASANLSAGQPVTTDRFAGPQPLPLAVAPLVTCPGADATNITWSTSAYLVGQWRITTPDGVVSTVDTGQFLNVY